MRGDILGVAGVPGNLNSLREDLLTPSFSKGGMIPYKDGGMIVGEGTPTSDSISADMPPGAFIVSAKMLKMFGKPLFDYILSLGETASEDATEGQEETPVKVSKGELYIPPEAAKAFGLDKLQGMADATNGKSPMVGENQEQMPDQENMAEDSMEPQKFSDAGAVRKKEDAYLGIPEAGRNAAKTLIGEKGYNAVTGAVNSGEAAIGAGANILKDSAVSGANRVGEAFQGNRQGYGLLDVPGKIFSKPVDQVTATQQTTPLTKTPATAPTIPPVAATPTVTAKPPQTTVPSQPTTSSQPGRSQVDIADANTAALGAQNQQRWEAQDAQAAQIKANQDKTQQAKDDADFRRRQDQYFDTLYKEQGAIGNALNNGIPVEAIPKRSAGADYALGDRGQTLQNQLGNRQADVSAQNSIRENAREDRRTQVYSDSLGTKAQNVGENKFSRDENGNIYPTSGPAADQKYAQEGPARIRQHVADNLFSDPLAIDPSDPEVNNPETKRLIAQLLNANPDKANELLGNPAFKDHISKFLTQ